MNIAFIVFAPQGMHLANRIAAALRAQGDEVTVDRCFDDKSGGEQIELEAWTAEHFESADALVFVGAAGIAVRSIAPYVKSKLHDPAVIVVDICGTWCIPLLSGHVGGANALAERIARVLEASCVLTTGTDVTGSFAVDSWAAAQGLIIANPEEIKHVSSALISGDEVTLFSEIPIEGAAPAGIRRVSDGAGAGISVGVSTDASGLRLVPRCVVLGIGCKRGTSAETISAAASKFLAKEHIDERALAAVASIDLKADEAGLSEFAKDHGVPFLTYPAAELAALEGEFSSSEFVAEVTGVDNVCERAVAAAGAILTLRKVATEGVTLALGIRSRSLSFDEIGEAESRTCTQDDATSSSSEGKLYVVGIGPGDLQMMTGEARAAIEAADMVCGYPVYVDLIAGLIDDKTVLTTPMGKETERCQEALVAAASGRTVALVCSGDGGVYGLAGRVLELAGEHPDVDIEIVSGVTAALSGAAVLGAPLTHDFAVISLSDLLTPWLKIEQRLDAAAAADFCICLYNPASRKRRDHLQHACDIMLRHKNPETVCGVVRNIGREGQSSEILTLGELRECELDMFCTVFVGNAETRIVGGRMVTPRGYERKE